MTKLNKPQPSDAKWFSFKNSTVTLGLAITMLLSACGNKTEEKLNGHDIKFDQTEQIDSLQTGRLDKHGERLDAQAEALVEITRILKEHGVKIEDIYKVDSVQTQKIAELSLVEPRLQAQLDILAKCCDAEKTQETPKKKPVVVVKKPTIEDENAPSDTTKTVKPGAKKDGEAFSF